MSSSDKYLQNHLDSAPENPPKTKKDKKSRKSRAKDELPEEDYIPTHAVTIVGEEMPDGARDSDDEGEDRLAVGDPHAALAHIDLDEPLRPGESLPVPAHRPANDKAAAAKSATLNGVSSPEPDVDAVVAEVKAEQRKQRKKADKDERKKKKKKSEKPAEAEGNLLVDLPSSAAPAASEIAA